MALRILRESFGKKLLDSVLANAERYTKDKSWIHEFADGKPWFLETRFAPASNLELLKPEGDDKKDVENSIRVHKALSFLSPVQARDPRLWTRLAHDEFWSYMRSRWEVERCGDDAEKAKKFIVERYFIAQNQSRALLRHGIARLWWYGHTTFDPSRPKPYELTSVLLSKLDITQTILERRLGRAPHVMSGFLEFLLRHSAELMGSGDGKRAQIRHLAKHLNLYGGSTLLDCLGKTDIMSILEDEYRLIVQRPEFVESR